MTTHAPAPPPGLPPPRSLLPSVPSPTIPPPRSRPLPPFFSPAPSPAFTWRARLLRTTSRNHRPHHSRPTDSIGTSRTSMASPRPHSNRRLPPHPPHWCNGARPKLRKLLVPSCPRPGNKCSSGEQQRTTIRNPNPGAVPPVPRPSLHSTPPRTPMRTRAPPTGHNHRPQPALVFPRWHDRDRHGLRPGPVQP
jgi:hypothetical protein